MFTRLLAFLRGLFETQAPARARSRAESSRESGGGERSSASGASRAQDPAAPLPSAEAPRETRERAATRRSNLHLDAPERLELTLHQREESILAGLAQQIEAGRFELPQLPSTSTAVMDLAAKPSAEMRQIVALVQTDPVLWGELLKVSNSVLYAGAEPCETLQAAVVRIGLKSLRTMIFSLSMRGAILRDRSMAEYAEEVWRQSYSMGTLARAMARNLRIDPDKAFLMALLADIGKVSLLSMLRTELRRSGHKESELSPALVGRVFHRFHEAAGAALAKAWRLPDEFVAVAGCHHHFEQNERFAASAALVSLAHRFDLMLTQGDDEGLRLAQNLREFDFLQLSTEQRRALITAVEDAFHSHHSEAEETKTAA